MSWSYYTNFMGPISLSWYEKNGIPFEIITMNNQWTKFEDMEYKNYLVQYAGGRIDCRCNDMNDPDYDHYGAELGLPIMEASVYNSFSDWLENIKTDGIVTFEWLKAQYEKETGKELVLFKEKD